VAGGCGGCRRCSTDLDEWGGAAGHWETALGAVVEAADPDWRITAVSVAYPVLDVAVTVLAVLTGPGRHRDVRGQALGQGPHPARDAGRPVALSPR
jgi:hypothetical protein